MENGALQLPDLSRQYLASEPKCLWEPKCLCFFMFDDSASVDAKTCPEKPNANKQPVMEVEEAVDEEEEDKIAPQVNEPASKRVEDLVADDKEFGSGGQSQNSF